MHAHGARMKLCPEGERVLPAGMLRFRRGSAVENNAFGLRIDDRMALDFPRKMKLGPRIAIVRGIQEADGREVQSHSSLGLQKNCFMQIFSSIPQDAHRIITCDDHNMIGKGLGFESRSSRTQISQLKEALLGKPDRF